MAKERRASLRQAQGTAQRRRSSGRSSRRGRRLTGRRGFWIIGLGAAFLVVGVGILLLARQRAQGAPLPTVEQLTVEGDVVKGDTVVGIHEMGAPEIPTAPSPPEGPPRLVLPEQFHDFGAIPATDKVDYTFPVRNEGQGTLTASRVYTTCGCTTAELSSRVIPAGKQATLKVVYDPAFHDVEGEVRRSVILETNDPEWGGQVEVSIQANVQK